MTAPLGSKIHTFFGFKNQKLVTVIQSTIKDPKLCIDCDYVLQDIQDAEQQILAWKKQITK